jgi:hypothetical protein
LSLRHDTLVWRIIFIPAVVNLLHGPQFTCASIFLTAFFLRHATVARLDTFLQSQLLPGTKITSGQFLWLSTSPRSWLPATMPYSVP